jgi:hypothetical protein
MKAFAKAAKKRKINTVESHEPTVKDNVAAMGPYCSL